MTVEQRLERLERENRWMRWFGAGGVLVAAIALVLHFTPRSVLRTRLLEIVNNGRVCGRFGFGQGFPSPYGEVGFEMTSGRNWLGLGLAPDRISFAITDLPAPGMTWNPFPESPDDPVLAHSPIALHVYTGGMSPSDDVVDLELSTREGGGMTLRSDERGATLGILDKDGKVIWKAPGE